jgi:uncharacterized lipoprotein
MDNEGVMHSHGAFVFGTPLALLFGRRSHMKTVLVIFAAVALAACARDAEYESAGALDTTADSTADTTARLSIPDVDVGVTTDTLNIPTFGTQKDTIIVDKPVSTGRRPVEVKRPTVDVNKKP